MALILRKGTEAERAAMVAGDPQEGELIYITDTGKLYRGDGSTAGGIELGGSGEVNTASNDGSGVSIFNAKSGTDLGFNGIKSENTRLTVALDAVSHDGKGKFALQADGYLISAEAANDPPDYFTLKESDKDDFPVFHKREQGLVFDMIPVFWRTDGFQSKAFDFFVRFQQPPYRI